MTQTIEPNEPELTTANGGSGALAVTPENERDDQLKVAADGVGTGNASELEEAKALASSPTAAATGREESEDANQQLVKQSNSQLERAFANAQANDPVESEPYCWHECTVGINIQLIPDAVNKEHYETAIIGVRTHNDAPIIKRVAAKELLPLPECIKELLREMREQLPARAEHRAERLARAAKGAAHPSSVKGQPAKTKVKPGRYIAAQSTGAQKGTVEPEAFDDDLFSAPPMREQTGALDDSNDQEDFASESKERAAGSDVPAQSESRLPTARTNPPPRREKYDKHGRPLKEKQAASPQNQMSLI